MSMSRKSPAKKGQHLRLKQKLTEKFVQKYGSRHRKVIQSELNALFRVRKKAITTKDIATLERRVQQKIKNNKKEDSSAAAAVVEEAQIKKQPKKQGMPRMRGGAPPSPEKEAIEAVKKLDKWTLLDVSAAVKYDEELEKKRTQKLEDMRRLQSELEAQIDIKRKQEVEEKGADKEYVEYVMNDQELYHKEERAKKREYLRKQRAIRDARAKQIAQNNQIRAEEERRQREFAEWSLAENKRLIEEDKQKALAAKDAQRRNQEAVRQQNEELERLRAIEREKERLEDQRLMAEYTRREEAKEQARRDRFEAIKKKQVGRGQQLKKAALDAIAAAERAEMERVNREAAQQERRAIEREERERKERERKTREAQKILAEQVAFKKEQERKEREAFKNYKTTFQLASENNESVSKREVEGRRYREALEEQIRQKKQSGNQDMLASMSGPEERFNSEAIEQVLQDEDTLIKVAEKIGLDRSLHK